MERIGEAFIECRVVNLDSTNVKDLEIFLESVQKGKESLKDKLDTYLEEIYN